MKQVTVRYMIIRLPVSRRLAFYDELVWSWHNFHKSNILKTLVIQCSFTPTRILRRFSDSVQKIKPSLLESNIDQILTSAKYELAFPYVDDCSRE